jgi:isoleucyl-tRNA synthetase
MSLAEPKPATFVKVASELDFPGEEREVLALWKEKRIFEQSLKLRKDGPRFVFYEGPPTANGLPHNGHVLTRVIKDLFPRYKTMRGYYVPRKAGWDTHGLPVEVEVEKELRIHGKAAIEEYGVEPFIAKCIQSVFRYTDEWTKLTERVAFWVDLEDAYVTYHKSYVESVWWALSELFKKGLLYQGHKVVWWWAQGGTALSSGEVGQGYKTVDDPSVYVAFPLKSDPKTSLLVWTTTPWTLPSNAYAAVNPSFDYAVVRAADDPQERKLIVAKALVEPLSKKLKSELTIERELKGSELVGVEYVPPFDLYAKDLASTKVATKAGESQPLYWRVIGADFVLLDQTGIVHIAPAFGEDDFQAHRRELAKVVDPDAVPLLCAVKPDGTFVPELTKYAGRWVKDCDKDIQHELKERHLLVHAEQYRHDYPFCWRADDDALIQYARPAWYIRTTALIDKAIENNRQVEWIPEHIKEGRFGDFLANNVDWALSRERYWGTPLNVWINDVTGTIEAPASIAEILQKNPAAFDHFYAAKKADPSLSEHLIVHKPWIDQVTWKNVGEEGTYRRVPEVIDCWFDSGCMPFAQWGFPHADAARTEEFRKSFPADFISEAIDQTRGWFYSLLMISTLVFDEECQKRFGVPSTPFPHPYKTCIVLGHVGDKEGKKESKSKGNYTPPEVILDEVKMDFAVLDVSQAEQHLKFKGKVAPGTIAIAQEDLDGLDLVAGATVEISGPKGTEKRVIQAGKGLPRRVVLVDAAARDALGVKPTAKVDVKPVEVPRLADEERLAIKDPASQAPGADAFRWFFYASNPPWSSTRHSLSNVRALQKEFLIKLRNVYSFFTIYANIDGFDPFATERNKSRQSELDRWILSELALTTQQVTADLDAYDVYTATQRLTAFVDALSNWYVRRSRERFWRAGWDADKASAYTTLYKVLTTTAKLIAPFVPHLAERIYQNLVVGPSQAAKEVVPESVHLTMFPEADTWAIDASLSQKMRAVRDVVSVGLKVRTDHKLKVRQPLRRAHIVLNNVSLREALADHKPMILEELNVLDADFLTYEGAQRFGQYAYKPNFRSLGQRGLGKQAQELKKAWATLSLEDKAILDGVLVDGKGTYKGIDLVRDDIEASFETKEGFAAAGDRVGVVVLETTLDDELRDLGFARELLSRIQTARKELGLEYYDRIALSVVGGERVARVMAKQQDAIAKECLATSVSLTDAPAGATPRDVDVEGEPVTIAIARV